MKINKHYWARYVKFIMAKLNRPKPDCYTESHHVWPRCLGGLKGQCVDLTAREHYIAHWILSKCFEDKPSKIKMLYASYRITCNNELSSGQIERARMAMGQLKGEDHFNFGKKRSEETKQRISLSRKEYLKENPDILIGKNNPFYGKKHSEEARAKISLKNKGRSSPNKDSCLYNLTDPNGEIKEGYRQDFVPNVMANSSFSALKHGGRAQIKGWSMNYYSNKEET